MARSLTFKYTVTVSNPGSGNRYYIDGNLQQYVVLFPGCTYEFNQDDSSNSGHPLRFSETSDGTHNSGTEYTTGVTTSGTPGSATAWTKIEVTSDTPYLLYYYCSVHSGMGGEVNTIGGSGSGQTDRAVFMGGLTPSASATMDFVFISSTGNATDFGDLPGTQSAGEGRGSSETRGVAMGSTSVSNVINTIELSSTGNGSDFGNLTQSVGRRGGNSNKIKAVVGGGETPSLTNVIDYVILSSVSNALDFGDLSQTRSAPGGASSPTRVVFAGGEAPSFSNVMDYVDIATTGNASDFGDLTTGHPWYGGLGSNTRGVFAGGYSYTAPADTWYDAIEYITFASTGNATDFGDLLNGARTNGTSNNTRGLYGGTNQSPGTTTVDMQYLTIATTGNTVDFGDLTEARFLAAAVSGSHGGIS